MGCDVEKYTCIEVVEQESDGQAKYDSILL